MWEYGFYYSVIDGYDEFRAGEAAGIAGLETPDPHTLIVHLDRPTGDLPYRLAMHATAPVPAGAADGHLGEYFRFLVSSGPYMIEGSEDLDPSLPPTEQRPVSGFTPQAEIDAGGEPRVGLTLARNPSWDPATDPLRGAYADRIELVLRPIPQLGTAASDRAIARRLDRGAVDLTLVGSLGQLDRYRSDPALADRLAVSPQDDLNYLPMNLAVPPFDDIEVRKAVNLAIDKSVLADRFIELTSPDTLFVPLAHLLPDATEGGLLGPGWRARWAAGVGPEGDLAAARRAMARSRYDADGDGRCDAAPCRSVEVLVDETASVPGHRYGWFWRQVRDDLAPLGIVIEARIEDCEDALDVAGHPSERVPLFIGVCVGWLSDFPSGSGVFQPLLHGGSINDRNNQNYSLLGASGDQLRRWGYDVRSAPSLDVRIDACLQQIGRAQIGCWADLDRFAMEEVVPWVPLYTTSSLFVLSDRVASWSYSVFGRSPALDRIALVPGSG